MFMGEYHHNIDEKSRIIMPSKFRYDLGETFVITRGIDSCLFVYPKETWNNITNKLIGVNDRIEIWSKENFDKFLNESMENVTEIAEHLFEV